MFYISKENWKKIINYARGRVSQTGDEVGGMAVIIKDKEGDYIVKEPTILKQETTGATCVLDKFELANYYVDMGKKYGKDTNFLWWHSHARMKAYWSNTDTDTMTEYQNGSWSAFLVVNVEEEHQFSIKYWEPIEQLVDAKLNLLDDMEDDIPKEILKELEDKCSETKIVTPPWKNNKWQRNHNQQMHLGYYNINNQPYYQGDDKTVEVDKNITVSEVCDLIEPLIDGFCDGTLTKKGWNKEVKEYNSLLETAESKYRIKKISGKELKDKALSLFPIDLIIDEDGNEINWTNGYNSYGWGG